MHTENVMQIKNATKGSSVQTNIIYGRQIRL